MFTLLKLFLSKAVGAGSFLMKNWQLTLGILVAVFVGWKILSWVNGYKDRQDEMQKQVISMQQKLNIETADKLKYKSNYETASAIAANNSSELQKLKEHQASVEIANAKLASTLEASRKIRNDLQAKIDASKPEDDGQVAPVLKSTITDVQADREQRGTK